MELPAQFELERLKRDLDHCTDVQHLRSLALKFLKLYLAQQATVKAMARQGWISDAVL